MFITRNAQKSPIAALFLEDGEAGWPSTELALQQLWFLVQLEESDPDDAEFSCNRTVLLFDFRSVEQFLLSGQSDDVRMKSAYIVTPEHVNGGKGWKMDQLRAVWQGREPVGEYERPMDIFETVSGEKYPASFSSVSIEEMVTDKIKFEFSQ